MSREENKLLHATVSWTGEVRPPPLDAPGPAPALGNARYVVEEQLGAGGMGMVYAAHDRELNRRVALKVLRSAAGSPQGDGALQREAQAMARLQHPNVVAVYDVGRLESGQLFVAMELVQGQSLRAWLRAEERGWREILGAFLAAGRGLSAAHEAGLIHRDFKPDNVLVSRDGAIRVADFGLAQPVTGADALHAKAGTPRYMAPEQRAGQAVDARTDQYAFCVALYEALAGEHPSEAGNPGADAPSTVAAPEPAGPARPAHAPAAALRARRIPKRLRALLLRGLEPAPEKRWESLPALLDALERAGRPPRWPVAVGVLLLVALVAGLGVRALRASEICSGAEQAFGDAWSDARRAKVRAAFISAVPAHGAALFDEVDQTLARYHSAWDELYVEACRATRVRGEQSEATLDLRMRCLDERQRELAGLVPILESADAQTAERSLAAVQRLPELGFCSNVNALATSAQPPVDAAHRDEVRALEQQLAEQTGLHRLRAPEQSAGPLDALIARLRELDQRQLLARALTLRAEVSRFTASMTRACSEAEEAALLAFETRDDATAADAWIALTEYEGQRGVLEQSDQAARLAKASIVRLGGDALRKAALLYARCKARIAIGQDFDERRSVCESAHARLAQVLGPDDLRLADADDALGLVDFIEGKNEAALGLYRKALAQRTRLLGPQHLRRDASRANIASALSELGRIDEALVELRDLMDSHPNDPGFPWGVAEALHKKGAFAEALSLADRSIAIYRTQGDATYVAAVLCERADLLMELSRPREALAALDEVFESHANLTPTNNARSAILFARAVAAARPRDLAPARARLVEARGALAGSASRFGGDYQQMLGEMDRWLSAHPAAEP